MIISTIVDDNMAFVETDYGYKVMIISTIVDLQSVSHGRCVAIKS